MIDQISCSLSRAVLFFLVCFSENVEKHCPHKKLYWGVLCEA